MREGAAVVGCDYPIPNCCTRAAQWMFFSVGEDVSRVVHPTFWCDVHGPSMWQRYDHYRWSVLLQPALATDEEVLCVEVMCHAIAGLSKFVSEARAPGVR